MNNNNTFYSAVYFDCDSTLVDIEGIDELAGFHNKKSEVARLTTKSMGGDVKLEDVFALKLAMIRPSRSDFDRLGKLYVHHVVEDAKEVIAALKFLNKTVVVMTGNFYPAVKYLTHYLDIDPQYVFANNIHFDEKGDYLTFDSKGPLSVAGGKRSLMMILKRDDQNVVFVGDGSTDIETHPPVEFFIGYGGVVERKKVKQQADLYVSCRSLAPILPFILTRTEQQKILRSVYKNLYNKAELLVKNGSTKILKR